MTRIPTSLDESQLDELSDSAKETFKKKAQRGIEALRRAAARRTVLEERTELLRAQEQGKD